MYFRAILRFLLSLTVKNWLICIIKACIFYFYQNYNTIYVTCQTYTLYVLFQFEY